MNMLQYGVEKRGHVGEIICADELNYSSYTQFKRGLLWLVNRDITDIHLFLFSEGGDVGVGFAMYEDLREIGKELTVSIFCSGNIQSCAVTILQAASSGQRVATPLTNFMVHAVYQDELERKTRLRIREKLELTRLTLINARILAERSGKSVRFWRNKMKDDGGDYEFTAAQALKMGVIDRISN